MNRTYRSYRFLFSIGLMVASLFAVHAPALAFLGPLAPEADGVYRLYDDTALAAVAEPAVLGDAVIHLTAISADFLVRLPLSDEWRLAMVAGKPVQAVTIPHYRLE